MIYGVSKYYSLVKWNNKQKIETSQLYGEKK